MSASSQTGTVAMTGAAAAPAPRSSTASEERFAPGAMLAQRYRIAGRLGRGGMGEVYRAYDVILDQDVALKFLPASVRSSPGALDRFRNEVRLARQVSHPNVCRVYDIGEIEDAPFLSMEYVDGEDLASLLRRIGRLPADKALDIARRLCAGLAAAHEKGVLHRDLKPANVMIDGRGEVLIADFGLAAVAGSVDEAAIRQGTPAYQAPEQLAGREVTVKSDLYALGLVLYEMFTGKRAFEAGSTEELKRKQRESVPAGVTTVAKDVDPAVERAILRCLAPEPRQRPASAKAVAASLPGGDPLAAALAAGETPSPAMVAQAGEGEGLRPRVAIAMLAVTLVCLLASVAVRSTTGFQEVTPFENSPEVLAATARDTVQRLGYTARPADTAIGIYQNDEYLHYAPQHYSIGRIRAQFAAARPAPLVLWYRQSPQAMNPQNTGLVEFDEPGFSVPGMVRLRLDMEGRLTFFEARPAEQTSAQAAAPDWKPLFDAARLDPARLQPATPEWTPDMAFDASAAWTGVWPEVPEVPIRIEAAAWRGKPVSFRIVYPWTRPAAPVSAQLVVLIWFGLMYCAIIPVGAWLARRNLRLKRGDRQGAVRLGAAVFALMFAGELLRIHYLGTAAMAENLFVTACISLGNGALIGVAYLAIEPYVRRRSPRLLISWARLQQNGPRDPLVGADVLAGLTLGTFFVLLWTCSIAVRFSVAQGIDQFIEYTGRALDVRRFLGGVLGNLAGVIAVPLSFVFFFFLMRLLLRREALAAAALGVLALIIFGSPFTALAIDIPLGVTIAALSVFALLRFGLLGMAAFFLLDALYDVTPWTLDPSRWFFGYSLTLTVLFAALAVWAFRTALGGRKLLSDETLG